METLSGLNVLIREWAIIHGDAASVLLSAVSSACLPVQKVEASRQINLFHFLTEARKIYLKWKMLVSFFCIYFEVNFHRMGNPNNSFAAF